MLFLVAVQYLLMMAVYSIYRLGTMLTSREMSLFLPTILVTACLRKTDDLVSLRPQMFTTIGNNVFIGMRSIILQGTNIGDNVIIGAGSVVSGKVESNSVYAGNPAKKICSLEEHKNKLAKRFPKSAAAYAKGFQMTHGRIPTNEEMVIYSSLISGYEDSYNGINKNVLQKFKKYKSVEELMETNLEEI